jgi:hypothetical protein
MAYRGYYGSYPLLDNRLYGTLNEYAELNDVANKNNYIYANSVADNYRKGGCHNNHHRPYYYDRPSLYSVYSSPYLYGGVYGYGYPYINPYGVRYPYFL